MSNDNEIHELFRELRSNEIAKITPGRQARALDRLKRSAAMVNDLPNEHPSCTIPIPQRGGGGNRLAKHAVKAKAKEILWIGFLLTALALIARGFIALWKPKLVAHAATASILLSLSVGNISDLSLPKTAPKIDFENLLASTLVIDQYPGLTLAIVLTDDISLNEFEFPSLSVNNVIFDDGPLFITFAGPLQSFDAYFTHSAPVTVTAFDAGGNEVGQAISMFMKNEVLSGDPGSIPNELRQITPIAGISAIVIRDSLGGAFTLDDLSYSLLAGPLAMTTGPVAMTAEPVAESSTLLLLGIALGLMTGVTLRRRRATG